MTDHAGEGSARCPECGESLHDAAESCPACGASLAAEATSPGLTDQYSPVVWFLSLVVAFLTFPFGLVVPLYFLFKARGDEPVEQGRMEVAAVLLLNLVGIAAVELRGESGARFALGFVAAMLAMGLILLLVFLLGAAA